MNLRDRQIARLRDRGELWPGLRRNPEPLREGTANFPLGEQHNKNCHFRADDNSYIAKTTGFPPSRE
jgi:hypothetical protein